MKYLQLSEKQVNGIKALMNSPFKYIELLRTTLDNGDTLVLMGDKQEDNSVRCIWVSSAVFDNKSVHEVMPS